MRKLIALLTILVIAGPAWGFACDCCPMPTATNSSSAPTLISPQCDCCPDAIDIKEKNQGVHRDLRLFADSILSRVFHSALTTAVSEFGILDFEHSAFDVRAAGPPDSSHTPLYLTLQILRI